MASGIPHPIPYQGSKRRLASIILEYFPTEIDVMYEPFSGSAAVTLAAATNRLAKEYVLGDSLGSLVEIWRLIINNPKYLYKEYKNIWESQHEDPRAYYDTIREEFNQRGGAARLLFLLSRCVKNAVRFNSKGNFNQSPDKRRLGTRPERMQKNIELSHLLLSGKTNIYPRDYSETLALAGPSDLVYMDPPYQGTSLGNDQRYHQQLDLERFILELVKLRERGVPFILSFDGRSGGKTYGVGLPDYLGLTKVEIHAGRSSQATLNGKSTETYESLYLSPELAFEPIQLQRSIKK